MFRIRNLLFIFAVVFIAINSFAIDGYSEVLSKEYLVNNEWGPDIGDSGLFFTFSMEHSLDNTFRTAANFEGGAYYSGTYKISDNRLFLKINEAGESPELIGKELSYKLVRDTNTIFFTKYLELENRNHYKHIDRWITKLWNHNTIVKNGEKRIYRNRKVETINNLAIVKETTNYYQFPSATSKRVMFSIQDKNGQNSPWAYRIPPETDWFKNRQVQLILRTTELDSNKQRWYYIRLPLGCTYDSVKVEGTSDYWHGSELGWIKEKDIERIIKK